MDFLGIGTGEILLIIILIFLVFEPDKMPQMAETIGRIIRQIRQASAQFVNEVIRGTEENEKEMIDSVKKNNPPGNSNKQSGNIDHE